MNLDNSKYVDLASSLEALLFIQGDVIYISRLPKLLDCTEEDAVNAVEALEQRIKSREYSGITLIRTDIAIGLATTPEISQKLSVIQQKVLDRDIGPAGLEILSIILYIGPSTRSKIDYIRGVNSTSTIRLLLMRKLVERIKNPDDAREYLYKPTVELYAFLGISTKKDLPDYEKISKALEEFINENSDAFNQEYD
jgi:segregation and condensation protein B